MLEGVIQPLQDHHGTDLSNSDSGSSGRCTYGPVGNNERGIARRHPITQHQAGLISVDMQADASRNSEVIRLQKFPVSSSYTMTPLKELAIATVFSPSSRNPMWYQLQKRFINRTTGVPFDYRIVLNGVDPAGFDTGDVLLVNERNIGHGEALMQLIDYFREHRYQAYLILDSDCFPVMAAWYHHLRRQMRRFNRAIAAPIRIENLDLFPHPCAFFLLDEVIDDPRIDFRMVKSCKTLLQGEVNDVGCAMQAMSDTLLPLLRTNVINVHPVAAAVYHHLFYHHGSGSRRFQFRILDHFHYYDHWFNNKQESYGDALYRALILDPEKFIDRLMGKGVSLKFHRQVTD